MEITRANVRVHSRCQRSARAFTRVAEQGVGYLSIISINFLLTRSEYSLRVLPMNVRREYSQQCEIGLTLKAEGARQRHAQENMERQGYE